MKKYIFTFNEGHKDMKHLLGGKGANLSEMLRIGLPVPPGFTLTTEACLDYYQNYENIPKSLINEIQEAVKFLEEKTKKGLGDPENPLLVSVRSGAVVSMPGMMDTVLNLGLNDETVEGLGRKCGYEFALDAYRRFIQMFSDVVLGIEKYKFDHIYDRYSLYDENTLREIIKKYKTMILKEHKQAFPENVLDQLYMTIEAVFKSWNNHRAKIYRKIHAIPDDLGTAVNVQAMVFGNFSDRSGTGVAFTRNPSTGENKLYGEYLLNAQGEDVVAGISTPKDIETLRDTIPEAYESFVKISHILEKHYKDMQDIEFTIEDEKLYILQTRNGKRTAHASVKIAVDLVEEGVLTIEEAIMSIDPECVHQLLHPTFSKKQLQDVTILAKGLPASPGAACGKIYLTAERVKEAAQRGESAILVRTETSPEDIEGMLHAKGILTARGGMTSHAAVVARGMGKCCIAGCSDVEIHEADKKIYIGDLVLSEGDMIALDGSTGIVYQGLIEAKEVVFSDAFEQIMTWSDQIKSLDIRANADQALDAKLAIDHGACGIGLCRTEHMFFNLNRIEHVRSLILSESESERKTALEKLKPHQKEDFYNLFKTMDGLPVNIRLLDPPLHEFLPKEAEDIKNLAKEMAMSVSALEYKIMQIQEVNPMLGHRGCRLGITYPEIYRMQVESIFEGIVELTKEGIVCKPEIMIPLVGFEKELSLLKNEVKTVADKILHDAGVKCDYTVGTMIEVPRAALTADEIGKTADFFSFGTNDLTQMTLGFSRDDSAKFIHKYQEKAIFKEDPFSTIDIEGVGKLMEMAKNLGQSINPNLKTGICGEHGGEPKSIEFCHKIGLDYVSCSPFRVPVARLAAAQAKIKNR